MLDVGHEQQVLDLVDDLRRDAGLTVVSTLHDLTVAGQYADTLVLLDGGRVVAAGSPADGAHRPADRVRLRGPGERHHRRRRSPGGRPGAAGLHQNSTDQP